MFSPNSISHGAVKLCRSRRSKSKNISIKHCVGTMLPLMVASLYLGLVSTLSICIVFVPVVFLTGAVQSLFTPLALAVVVAMLASYFLSRTLVPTMVQYLLRSELH